MFPYNLQNNSIKRYHTPNHLKINYIDQASKKSSGGISEVPSLNVGQDT
jgi:hypothetical protein